MVGIIETFGPLTRDNMGPRKNSQSGNGNGDNEYLSRRARNNEAVKRSREKARQRAQETHTRVTKLKTENEMLEERIKLLSKELTFLKDIFMAHAGGWKLEDHYEELTPSRVTFFSVV
eukprot:TCALIF_01444-PA protein Name:"Similar to CEBPG CCAAT/enhancer-binding protein gamma (Homo sapiens)" AED:0.11 eAED:0.11 QI:0/0/0.5/0.5/0/0.5/2/1197/117